MASMNIVATTMPQQDQSTDQRNFMPEISPDMMSANRTEHVINIPASSMMSTTVNPADLNLYPDNISAILGSDITDNGGSFELARRFHGGLLFITFHGDDSTKILH